MMNTVIKRHVICNIITDEIEIMSLLQENVYFLANLSTVGTTVDPLRLR